jgi:hypothetical protein
MVTILLLSCLQRRNGHFLLFLLGFIRVFGAIRNNHKASSVLWSRVQSK